MEWNKYRLKTTTAAVDMISFTLSDMGITGIEVEDKIPLSEEDRKAMFIDILPEPEEDDGTAYVSFYTEPEQEYPGLIDDIIKSVRDLSEFVDVGELTVEKSVTAEEDWINNWKKYWKPFKVDDDILIKPTWENIGDSGGDMLVVELDPGTSFGTGMHETTRLCISQIKKYLKKGQLMLDVGCGSGILSVIGIMLGAESAMATDIDPHAVSSAAENAKVNHIDEKRFTALCGDIITDPEFRAGCGLRKYDLAAANILADVIIPLSGVIKDNMKPGGIFISSGIILSKEQDVHDALEKNGFEILEVTHMGEWVAFTARA